MTVEHQGIDDHVGELLSGLVDGELTQQVRQRVELHCESCEQCAEDLQALRQVRERLGKAALSNTRTEQWRETMNDTHTSGVRTAGWLIFIGGLLLAGGAFLLVFLSETSVSIFEKVVFLAIYGGLGLLLYSVLRQRLIERKTDRYKDVEI